MEFTIYFVVRATMSGALSSSGTSMTCRTPARRPAGDECSLAIVAHSGGALPGGRNSMIDSTPLKCEAATSYPTALGGSI